MKFGRLLLSFQLLESEFVGPVQMGGYQVCVAFCGGRGVMSRKFLRDLQITCRQINHCHKIMPKGMGCDGG